MPITLLSINAINLKFSVYRNV